ncbi:MAG: hypothetical protein WAL25_10325 [Acidimicrobiia bacterium]
MSQGNTLTLFGIAVLIAGLLGFSAVTAGVDETAGDATTPVVAAVTLTPPVTSIEAPTLGESIRRILAEGAMPGGLAAGDVDQLPETVVRVLIEQGAALVINRPEASS